MHEEITRHMINENDVFFPWMVAVKKYPELTSKYAMQF
jgi:iron-sulfur cluster repair protein YtfE (RIC family)